MRTTPTSPATGPPGYQPADYARAAWTLVKRDPRLVLWRVGADLVRWAVLLTAVALAGGVLLTRVVRTASVTGSWGEALGAAVATITSPTYAVGALGLAMVVLMATLSAQAVAYSRIWQAMSLAARGRDSRDRGGFAAGVRASFADALGLRALLLLVDVWLVVGIVSLVLPLSRLAPRIGEALGSDVLAPALAWAATLTFLGAIALVWRVSAEFVAAALFIDRVPLGVAMLRGANTAVRHLGQIYRILVGLAGYLLIPLGLYWALLMLYNVAMAFDVPGLGYVGTALQLLGEVVLLAAFATLSVMIQAAAFLFYGVHHDLTPELPGRRGTGKLPRHGWPIRGGDGKALPVVGLEDLLPLHAPQPHDLDQLLADLERGDTPTPQSIDSALPEAAADPFDLDALLGREEE